MSRRSPPDPTTQGSPPRTEALASGRSRPPSYEGAEAKKGGRVQKALVIVGMQNDFYPGGARAVPDAARVVVPLAALGSAIDHAGDLVIAHKEVYSASNEYFTQQGGGVEPYCVEGTRGAAFHSALSLPKRTRQVFRSDEPDELSPSAFHAVDRSGQKLAQLLREADATELMIGGLPTEYAVRATALDALRRGFGVTVIQDGVAALNPREGREILGYLRLVGAKVMSAGEAIMSLYHSGEVRLFHGP